MIETRVAGRAKAVWMTLFWLAVGVASWLLGVANALGQRTEAKVLEAAQYDASPTALLSWVSVPSLAAALAVIGIIAIVAHRFGRAARVVLVAGFAVVIAQLLKFLVLERPALFEFSQENTFPSGHVTVITAVVVAFTLAMPDRVRAFLALIGTAVIGVACWQILAIAWHRPSDVYGALALTAALFTLTSVLWPMRERGEPILGSTVSIILAWLGWIVIAAGVVLVTLAIATDDPYVLLTAGQFGGIGLGALVMHTTLRVASASPSASHSFAR